MTAALAFAKQGIQATIIEAEEEGRLRAGSRAIYIHKETLKLLESIAPGIGYELADIGIVWPVKRTAYRGDFVYKRVYEPPKPNALPAFSSLHQHEIEKALFKACQEANISFIWGEPVTGVQTSDEGVVITTTKNTYESKYVLAADGSRSAVRQALNIQFNEPRTSDTFVVVDVAEDPNNPLPIERIFHYQHPAVDGRNVMYVPFAGGWRIDLQLF